MMCADETEKIPMVVYENVNKYYPKRQRQLREVFQFHDERKPFHILKNINFTVFKGDRLAIIGGNGAGKSTMLKLISRITPPSTGVIQVNGTLASLLEVGAGFHPELTGYQNVYLNGSILGLSYKSIKQNMHQIIEYAEINPTYMHLPLSFFSSGMRARLGFSITQFINTDILILDETLSVGDISFRGKASASLENTFKSGRTVIFVTHDMESVVRLANRILWLEKGEVQYCGDVVQVMSMYLSYHKIPESHQRKILENHQKAAGINDW